MNPVIHTYQLSQNVRDSPRFTAVVPCPAQKMQFTLNVDPGKSQTGDQLHTPSQVPVR